MRMKLVLRLVETGVDGSSRSVDVLEIVGRSDPGDIAALGITLSQGKQLLGLIQREVERLRWRIWNGPMMWQQYRVGVIFQSISQSLSRKSLQLKPLRGKCIT